MASTLHRTTMDDAPVTPGSGRDRPGLTLTMLWNPDPSRIGLTASVPFERGAPVDVSRLTPVFADGRPLADPWVSRAPLQVVPRPDGGVELWPGRPGLTYTVDGRECRGVAPVEPERFAAGVQVALGRGSIVHLQAGRRSVPRVRHGLVGPSASLEAVRDAIERCAPTAAVLILGASGTGKELVARAIHDTSPRRAMPYVAVNLAAMAPGTAASQLFGHARGAFTGADRTSRGVFGDAEGGTLFLDEIGSSSTELQAALLRALESSEVQPVGGRVRQVDVRVVAATDQDLPTAMAEGRFLPPLFYRLAREILQIPPLRERPTDIAAQAVHFLRPALLARGAAHRLATSSGPPWLGRPVMEALLAHAWPGNSRELKATAERLAHHADDEACGLPVLASVALPMAEVATPVPVVRASTPAPGNLAALGSRELGDAAIAEAMEAHGWRIGATAKHLRIGRTTLRRRLIAMGHPLADELSADTIREALAEAGSVGAAARRLRVSGYALTLRIKALGLSRS